MKYQSQLQRYHDTYWCVEPALSGVTVIARNITAPSMSQDGFTIAHTDTGSVIRFHINDSNTTCPFPKYVVDKLASERELKRHITIDDVGQLRCAVTVTIRVVVTIMPFVSRDCHHNT